MSRFNGQNQEGPHEESPARWVNSGSAIISAAAGGAVLGSVGGVVGSTVGAFAGAAVMTVVKATSHDKPHG